jgi:hypothetical protein
MNMSKSKILMLFAVALFVATILHAAYSEITWATTSHFGETFVKAFGYMGPSRMTECLSARNPLLEPICLPDIPGGYCYHESCSMVGPTYVGKEYTIEVVHP